MSDTYWSNIRKSRVRTVSKAKIKKTKHSLISKYKPKSIWEILNLPDPGIKHRPIKKSTKLVRRKGVYAEPEENLPTINTYLSYRQPSGRRINARIEGKIIARDAMIFLYDTHFSVIKSNKGTTYYRVNPDSKYNNHLFPECPHGDDYTNCNCDEEGEDIWSWCWAIHPRPLIK